MVENPHHDVVSILNSNLHILYLRTVVLVCTYYCIRKIIWTWKNLDAICCCCRKKEQTTILAFKNYSNVANAEWGASQW